MPYLVIAVFVGARTDITTKIICESLTSLELCGDGS